MALLSINIDTHKYKNMGYWYYAGSYKHNADRRRHSSNNATLAAGTVLAEPCRMLAVATNPVGHPYMVSVNVAYCCMDAKPVYS